MVPSPRHAMNGQNGHPASYADSDVITSLGHDYPIRGGTSTRRRPATGRTPNAAAPTPPEKRGFTLDAGSLLRPASKRWYWVLLGGLLGAAAGVALGMWLWKVE